ncbi:hypothetical protein HRM2_15750 [Desulforapulum autotrophicum HRM2]|uniref:Uncharacterized protein n=1 Tax=Desulforapulum autotrophicum (strain ATCC 43914 / DSM 3382 / VKM B-1955 / HRM2) TaxID=177437 RepID=C0QA99_DESAH|nr:hypothetical protein [Desulforapulum autotrophicum]ACN14684.1 hypothetical protein HRM2_15750 [Desulforapulum autotrophicum HRM2]
MKRIFILLTLFCILDMTGGKIVKSQEPQVFRVGLSPSTLGTINHNDYTAAFKSWVTTIGKEQTLSVMTKVEVVNANENLQTAMLQEKFDALLLTVADLMRGFETGYQQLMHGRVRP